jgi:hypothetical protein
MITKRPTPQAISAALRKAGFERSAVLSRASLHHRYTAGFYTRDSTEAEVFVGHRIATDVPTVSHVASYRAAAREMTAKYAEALTAAGWPAEVTTGPLVRVTAKVELQPGDPIPLERTGGMTGFVVGECGHRVAGSEWRAGFRNCERCGG